MRKIILLMLGIWSTIVAGSASVKALEPALRKLIDEYDATVGVAFIADCGDTVTVNNDARYPLMSVMKLHQAVYVAHCLRQGGRGMEVTVEVEKGDLPAGTYSPLREKFPEGGVTLTVGQLLEYTLQLSDNNACDLLFKRFGGPAEVDACIRALGIGDFAIAATEADMHRDSQLCHANYSTPLAAARLIDRLFRTDTVGNAEMKFIASTLAGCHTGLQRIPCGVGDSLAVVAHKTGTSDRDARGRWTAINDVAHVVLADGRSYSLAVFVADSGESMEKTEEIIARISRAVFNCFVF